MKDKTKVLNTYGYMFDKLQFICLIGGRVCNPRQQQVAYSRLTTDSVFYRLGRPGDTIPPPAPPGVLSGRRHPNLLSPRRARGV